MNLHGHIAARIRQNGPLSVADYMHICLLHPDWGYYTSQTAFGAQGDFTTAPEISQMFGELIGLSLAQAWLDQGGPAPLTLAELGPGRGTLMADILRATKAVPGFLDSAQIALIEASHPLRQMQKIALAGHNVEWYDHPDALPQQPLFLIANEFLDALPIRQFVRYGRNWRERQIGLVEDALCFGLSPAAPQPALNHRLDDTKDGDLIEVCPTMAPMINPVATRIAEHGGAALIIDYGDWRSLGDTFQAVKDHKTTDPLTTPGQADLTAHVDFEAVAQAAAPAAHSRVTPQGVFLERLGIAVRAETLAKNLGGAALAAHIAAHQRLTHPTEMGNLFKVIGLMPPNIAPPAGLET